MLCKSIKDLIEFYNLVNISRDKLEYDIDGIVYKVKALCTSIFSTAQDKRVKLDSLELLKKYGIKKQQFGVNMQSSVENTNKTR